MALDQNPKQHLERRVNYAVYILLAVMALWFLAFTYWNVGGLWHKVGQEAPSKQSEPVDSPQPN